MIFKLVLMKFMLAISRYLLGLIVKKYLICFGKIVPGQTLKLCNILEYPLVPIIVRGKIKQSVKSKF